MGLWMGHSTKEVEDNVAARDIISHLYGAGPMCLLTPCSAAPPPAVALPSTAVCVASVDSVSREAACAATNCRLTSLTSIKRNYVGR